jgi:predicted acyl esterase
MAKRIGNIEVIYTPLKRELENVWTDYGYEKKILPKGWIKEAGRRPLPVDMIYEKDCPIVLRDGIKIYADVFRPGNSDQQPVPAILPWSIYGKTGTGQSRAFKQRIATHTIFAHKRRETNTRLIPLATWYTPQLD